MRMILLGTVGFVLYFVYDINSIKMKNTILQQFFGVGSLCLVIATVGTMINLCDFGRLKKPIGMFCAVASIFFLLVLIYTLFSLCLLIRHIWRKIKRDWRARKGCMLYADIRGFSGLQLFIYAYGESLVFHGEEFISYWWFYGMCCMSFFRICGYFPWHLPIMQNIKEQLPF